MAGLLSQRSERSPVRVRRLAKRRKAAQKSCDPFEVSPLNGMGEIFQFDAQESAHLSQIFNGPTSGRCPKPRVLSIDVSASTHQFLHHSAMPGEGRIVKGGGASCIPLIDKISVRIEDGSSRREITALCGVNQGLQFVHETPAQLVSSLHREQEWLFERFGNPAQEAGSVGSVDEAMIVGKRERQNQPRLKLAGLFRANPFRLDARAG